MAAQVASLTTILTPLEQLPNEILHHITKCAPLSSACCLALSSRSLSRKLGNYLEALSSRQAEWRWCFRCVDRDESLCCVVHNPQRDEFTEFLLLIQRDLVDTWLCYRCLKLHFAWNQPHEGTKHGEPWQLYAPFGPYEITTAHVQRSVSQLASQDLRVRSQHTQMDVCKTPYPGIWDIEARLVNGYLIVRVQGWVVAEPDEDISDMPTCVCFHLGKRPKRFGLIQRGGAFTETEMQLRCKRDDALGNKALECSCRHGRQRCTDCPTEYQVETKPVGQHKAVVITCWRNFGRGLSAEDPFFQAHRIFGPRQGGVLQGRSHQLSDSWYSMLGSPAEQFEEQLGTSIRELEENMAKRYLHNWGEGSSNDGGTERKKLAGGYLQSARNAYSKIFRNGHWRIQSG
jgi:hypothetical protein